MFIGDYRAISYYLWLIKKFALSLTRHKTPVIKSTEEIQLQRELQNTTETGKHKYNYNGNIWQPRQAGERPITFTYGLTDAGAW
jgi:hypothetical protein